MSARPPILPEKPGQQEFVERLLSGSQAKTAYALRMNAERMIKECPGGLESICFLTLTVGDPGPDGKFKQVWDSSEASRRINNLSRRVLHDLFAACIIVTERHKSGAIHFHILGALRDCADIRTGCDFAAFKRRDYRTAPKRLRELWAMLRATLPEYGFGRPELLPVFKTGEAVSSYVSKYIEKNVCNRLKADYRKKLVRYSGWQGRQMKPNEFNWATRRAVAWRWKARTMAGLIGIQTPEQAAEALGPRWAWHLTTLWQRTLGDDLFNGFMWTYPEQKLCWRELARLSGDWAKEQEKNSRSRFGAVEETIFGWHGDGSPITELLTITDN